MKRFLASLPLYFFLLFIHSALSQNKNTPTLNAFSNRIFDGKGYQPLSNIKWKFKTGRKHWLGEIGMWGMKPQTQYMEDLWDFYLSSPIFYKNGKTSLVLFGSSDGNVYSADAKTGTLKWKFKPTGLFTELR